MNLEQLKKKFNEDIKESNDLKSIDSLEVLYLGRKGYLTEILRSLAELTVEEKKSIGAASNVFKAEVLEAISKKRASLESSDIFNIDVTIPGKQPLIGHLHPITVVFDEVISIGKTLGFSVATGPEIETDYYNFEALNTPKDHPARDTQDSFYIEGSEELLLRSQTSPVQIRYMQSHKPPIRIIAPGRVYRRDSDATHTPMFHQLEGLLVDQSVTVTDLKGTLEYFVQSLFGKDRKIRLRPHHFPFTEPSFEVDISCGLCGGKGCKSCKNTGWLEVLGAGMVHPNVLRAGGIDPEKYQGFAFGMGIERIAMLKYGLDDMRLLYEGDIRLVEQF